MFSKRVLNAATIRYNLVSYVLKTCSSKPFDDVHVIDICREAGISKVTFFKYFHQKEDILLYYKSLLTLSLTIQVSQHNLQGTKGLDKIISHFSTEYKERQSLVLGLINKLTTDNSPYKPIRISPAEKYLFYPDIDFKTIDVLSLEQMIDKFILEAVLNGQINSSGNVEELSAVFLSTLYGAIVASHVKGDNHEKLMFQNTMRRLISHIR